MNALISIEIRFEGERRNATIEIPADIYATARSPIDHPAVRNLVRSGDRLIDPHATSQATRDQITRARDQIEVACAKMVARMLSGDDNNTKHHHKEGER